MLPNLLLIGAMKAGTTTLHRDLNTHSNIFFPEAKEPELLAQISKLTDHSLISTYRNLYDNRNEIYLGDASTAYSKFPIYKDVPKKCNMLLGDNVKIIYVIREPISRIKSHYYHNYSLRKVTNNIQEEISVETKYIDYSLYKTQLDKWLEFYRLDQVLVLQFEDYISNRRATLSKIYNFLNLADESEKVDLDMKLNVGGKKKVAHNFISRKIVNSEIYQYKIKKIVPWRIRDFFGRFLLSKSPKKPDLNFELTDEIQSRLESEYLEMKRLCS